MNVHVCLVIFSASNGTNDKVPVSTTYHHFPLFTIAYSYTSVGMTHGSDVIVGCEQTTTSSSDRLFLKAQWFDQGQQ